MLELLTGLGLAMPAGLNAYIPLFVVGLTARFTNLIELSAPYDVISSDIGLLVIGALLLIEVVADKVALVDHLNDMVQTFIRPTAGAILVLASTGPVDEIHPGLAILLGVLAAGSVHAVKATVRPAVTASTGGLGNPIVSTAEDGIALSASVVAILFPLLVIIMLALLVTAVVFAIRRVRRRPPSRMIG